MIADRAILHMLLAGLARTLHVGILVDCLFDPSIAFCVKHKSGPDCVAPS